MIVDTGGLGSETYALLRAVMNQSNSPIESVVFQSLDASDLDLLERVNNVLLRDSPMSSSR